MHTETMSLATTPMQLTRATPRSPFGDTAPNQNLSQQIELVRCPETDQYCVVDDHIYDSDRSSRSKRGHVQDLLVQVVQHRQLSFHAILMGIWYAIRDWMLFLDSLHKMNCRPPKNNRQADNSGSEEPYCRVDELAWTNDEWMHDKLTDQDFAREYTVKQFLVAVVTHRMDGGVINDLIQDPANGPQEVGHMNWKFGPRRRELKQPTSPDTYSARSTPSSTDCLAAPLSTA